MRRITWAIRDSVGNVVRTEVLDEGVQPTLKAATSDPVVGIIQGETATVVDVQETPTNEGLLEELRDTVLSRAQDERQRIMSQPGVAAAMLQRTESAAGKLSGASVDIVKSARAELLQVDTESAKVLAKIDAAKDADGIILPDWARA